MGIGTKGALGAALSTLGKGVVDYSKMGYSEQLQAKLQKAKEIREENLRITRENFIKSLEKTKHDYRMDEVKARGGRQVKSNSKDVALAMDAVQNALSEPLPAADFLNYSAKVESRLGEGAKPYAAAKDILAEIAKSEGGEIKSSSEPSTWEEFKQWANENIRPLSKSGSEMLWGDRSKSQDQSSVPNDAVVQPTEQAPVNASDQLGQAPVSTPAVLDQPVEKQVDQPQSGLSEAEKSKLLEYGKKALEVRKLSPDVVRSVLKDKGLTDADIARLGI